MKFVNFLKIGLLFNRFCCFCMFVKNISDILSVHISKTKSCHNVKPLAFIFLETKTSANFQIFISVPLNKDVFAILDIESIFRCVVKEK